MSSLECTKPWAPTPVNEPFVRCGRCRNCRIKRRLDWTGRIMLETWTSQEPAWFVTLTYKEEPHSHEACIAEVQRFIKRFRKSVSSVRYVVALEQGSKNHRSHHHAIMWFHRKPIMRDNYDGMNKAWGQGYIWLEPARAAGGLRYAAKYCVKDGHYSWSKRPMIGSEGCARWADKIRQHHEHTPFRHSKEVPVCLNTNLLGKRTKIWIPESYVKNTCLDLGVPDAPDSKRAEDDVLRVLYLGVPSGPLNTSILKERVAVDMYDEKKNRQSLRSLDFNSGSECA